MFEHFRVFETEFAGKKISFETGKMCCLAGGSVLVRYGETTVLVNATASKKPRDGIDFLPLSVDFEEKLYSVGKIPGSFLKREGRPSDKAILSSRVVDRPIRPLFPKDMRNDVTVVMTVLSVDPDCQPEIAGMIGASFALSISDIPWNGPIAGINIGLVDGEIILTPTAEQRAQSDLTLVVAGTDKKVCMIEAGAKEVADDVMLAAIMKGFAEIQKMVEFIKGVQAEIGKPKFTFESQEVDHDLFEAVKEYAEERVMAALDTDDKNLRDQNLQPIEEDVRAKFDPENERPAVIGECLYKLQKFIVRRWLLEEGKRVDGRKMDEIRPLAAEVGIIPRVHGSGMFTRGQTQVLTIATLGTMTIARGVAQLANNNYNTDNIGSEGAAQAFKDLLYYGKTMGVFNGVWIALIIWAIFFYILSYTRSGRHIYAIGSNVDAARLSGVNVFAATTKAYMVSSFCAFLTGLVTLAQSGMGDMSAGMSYEMYAVAAAVIGGVSTLGGSGLLVGEVRRNRQELLESLQLYYRVFILNDRSALEEERPAE